MNNFQYIVKDDTRAAMHMAVELCERGDFDSVTEAIRWLMQERGKSRWHELFGTPERAARTLEIIADNLYSSTWSDDNATLSDVMCALVGKCDECVAQGLPGRGVTTKCGEVDYDALLEWLKGEAE